MDLITLLVVGIPAVLVLGAVGSMLVPDIHDRLRQLWNLLSPPPM